MEWPEKLAALAAGAPTAREFLVSVLEFMRGLFEARIAGILLFESDDGPMVVAAGLRSTHVDEYAELWRFRDPVLKRALETRAPICESDALSSRQQDATPLCVDFGRRIGAAFYLVAPLYGATGEIVGSVHLCRHRAASPFGIDDVRRATALVAFLSAMLVRQTLQGPRPSTPALAPREHQIALLVARGMSNRDIAQKLGLATETVKQTLRRVYRKTNVATRVALVRHCAQLGWV